MTAFSKKWIRLNVFEIVIHPAHIPFEVKSQTAFFDISGYHRPRRRFFCDRKASVFAVFDLLI